ncbi:hypothetical protein [Dokdonella immobilis]|uniref:DUF2007 domain-containing protein n=1 Tax=Dokdonella immobilis TaxID=578942 RepID=A0A1I4XIG1_9GAMM|nr:hypothetical protein [Dokdonella immobilis]SFN25585.1 hypothetical protein SAMN05216289_11040 [Dokdonella immobilis]
MRCVERTLDQLDGLTVVALLRSRDLQAQLFDENLVRQNWFEIIFYGGFRVMAPDSQLGEARELVAAYRRGELALAEDLVERPPCPRCDGGSGDADAGARRNLWSAYILLSVFELALIAFWGAAEVLLGLFAIWMAFVVIILFGDRLLVGRYRCNRCGNAWVTRRDEPFSDQQRRAEQDS